MSGRYDQAYAQAILPEIPRVTALAGRSGDAIAAAVAARLNARFSRYKVQRGVAYIRDTYAVAADILITDRYGLYRFTLDLAAIDEWRSRRGRLVETINRRTYTGAIERVHRQHQQQHPRRVVRSKAAYLKLMTDLARLHQLPMF